MTNVKQTVATFMATHFGKSEKAVSEKLSTDEHNQFTSEAVELQTTITNLESERDTLQASVTTLEGEKTTLTNSLTETTTDRDKYKAWFEKQAGVGAELPKLDETSKSGPEMSSYNQQALETFRKAKGI